MDPHSIVVVSLHTPKEKIWGELLTVSTAVPSAAVVTVAGKMLSPLAQQFVAIAEDVLRRRSAPAVLGHS